MILLSGSPLIPSLCNQTDVSWEKFRTRLKPKFLLIYAELSLCYLFIILTFSFAYFINLKYGNFIGFCFLPILALFLGFWFHALSCFGHEAAHFNLAMHRKINDLIANNLICCWFAQDIKNYRYTHWLHHRFLGLKNDSETSYHHHPSFSFLLSTLLGIHALRVFRNRKKIVGSLSQNKVKPRTVRALLRMIVLHTSLVSFSLYHGQYVCALTWLFGFFACYPFFNTLRQILEHRSSTANKEADYGVVEHGPINRIFSDTIFSRYFGCAGFNKHLFHHWDPHISYTRFVDMEFFLLQTKLASHIHTAKTSYFAVFIQLLKKPYAKL